MQRTPQRVPARPRWSDFVNPMLNFSIFRLLHLLQTTTIPKSAHSLVQVFAQARSLIRAFRQVSLIRRRESYLCCAQIRVLDSLCRLQAKSRAISARYFALFIIHAAFLPPRRRPMPGGPNFSEFSRRTMMTFSTLDHDHSRFPPSPTSETPSAVTISSPHVAAPLNRNRAQHGCRAPQARGTLLKNSLSLFS